jgi:hypothetical protein
MSIKKEDKPTRLYRNLVRSIRAIGFIGYIGALIFSVVAVESMGGTSAFGSISGYLILIFIFTPLVFSLYVVTQSSVAIIDLLSRIEFNTRQH